MKLKEFEFEDFMKHRHTVVDCTAFQSAVIIGQTNNNLRKSMAVGKTTIFKGIEYAFFNFAPFNMEKIVRHGSEKCRVRVDFEVASGTYRVTRARTKKGKADLRLFKYELDDWQDITQKTAKETETELAKIIGISHGAWRASILFAQADLHGLASVTPRERKAMLKEPLQILIYNEYDKLAKKRSVAALKTIERTRVLIEALGDPTEDIKNLEITRSASAAKLEELNALLITAQINLDVAKAELAKLQASGTESPAELRSALENVGRNKEKTLRTIEMLDATIKQDLAKEAAAETDIKRLTQIIVDAEKAELTPPTLRTRDVIVQDITKMSAKELEGAAYISSLNTQKTKLSKTIPDLDLCDLCRQPVSKEHRENCEDKRKSDLQDTLSLIEKTQKVLESIRAKKTNLENELRQLDAFETAKTRAETTLNQRRVELDHAKKTVALIAETITSRNNELTNRKNYLQEEQAQETELRKKLEIIQANSNEGLIQAKQSEIASLTETSKNVSSNITAAHVSIGSINQRISSRQADHTQLENYAKLLKEQEKHHSLCVKAQQVFSPAGVPSWIINTILDDLQIEANSILAEIRPDIELNFSLVKTRADGNQEDTLDIFYRVNGVEHDYEQLSGGQKVIVALTLKMAMSHIIQHRIGVDIKLLNLDEVDSQFDDEGLDAFIEIIRKWQNKMTIFVITHNPYVKSKFTHAILVENDESNGSVGKLVYN